MGLRLFGRDVKLQIGKYTAITAIKSCSFEVRQRIVTEGYLGEPGNRQDEIYDEVGGQISFVPEANEVLVLQKMLYDRSRARTSNPKKIDLSFDVTWPDGTHSFVSVPDIKIDPMPFTVGSRDAYVEMSITYKAESYILS